MKTALCIAYRSIYLSIHTFIDIHTIVNLRQLNDAIKNGTNRKIGFLSSNNYESVRGYLDELAEPVIYGDTDEITNAVVQEEILAGYN